MPKRVRVFFVAFTTPFMTSVLHVAAEMYTMPHYIMLHSYICIHARNGGGANDFVVVVARARKNWRGGMNVGVEALFAHYVRSVRSVAGECQRIAFCHFKCVHRVR